MVPKGTSEGGAKVGGGSGVSWSGGGVGGDGVAVGVTGYSASNREIGSMTVVLVSVGWMVGGELVMWATTVRATAVGR
jgi:hypothetical protein